jgi:hypothetical protein
MVPRLGHDGRFSERAALVVVEIMRRQSFNPRVVGSSATGPTW